VGGWGGEVVEDPNRDERSESLLDKHMDSLKKVCVHCKVVPLKTNVKYIFLFLCHDTQ